MKSRLLLQIREDRDCNTFTVKDVSVYNPDIAVSCAELLITPPGFGDTFNFSVETGFDTAYTSRDFKYTGTDCDIISLQDGIYQIRYHICPTDEVFVEYNHLRQCSALNDYYEALCALKLEACYPTKKQAELLDKLRTIKQYFDAAKAYVEVCNAPNKGLELHNYAVEKLKELNITCTTC